jgi:hypothetical protein
MFGDRQTKNEERIEELELKLIESQQTLQKQIDELKQYCQTQVQSLKSIDQKLQYLCMAADGEFADVRQSLDRAERNLSQKLQFLEVDVLRQNRSLRLGLKKIKTRLSEEQKHREYRLVEELCQYYNRVLDTKISRDEISDLLLEICYKFEASRFLEANGENSTENPQEINAQ